MEEPKKKVPIRYILDNVRFLVPHEDGGYTVRGNGFRVTFVFDEGEGTIDAETADRIVSFAKKVRMR